MQIRFLDDSTAAETRIVACLVNQNALPAGLEPVLAEGAAMSRFAGGSDAAWAVEARWPKAWNSPANWSPNPPMRSIPKASSPAAKRKCRAPALVRVLHDAEMRRLGMGALLGVAQGSVREPRLLVMEWKGGGTGRASRRLRRQGRDVRYRRHLDQAGRRHGRHEVGHGRRGLRRRRHAALAKRGAKANVVGICGLVENMPDGNAQRPGDVVTSMSGQTIEVINTDAEGRLVLCDALTWRRSEFNPAAIIDLATLTGAMIVSLGHEYGGMFANDDELADKIDAAGKASGDKVWRFPMGKAYDKLIDSPIADMKNMGARYGGSITAAQFLQRFIEDKGTPGRTSTSPAWSGPTSPARPGTRARPAMACGCWTAFVRRYPRKLMRVDFYQLSRDPAVEKVLPLLARNTLNAGSGCWWCRTMARNSIGSARRCGRRRTASSPMAGGRAARRAPADPAVGPSRTGQRRALPRAGRWPVARRGRAVRAHVPPVRRPAT
jgi:hypothetical protein